MQDRREFLRNTACRASISAAAILSASNGRQLLADEDRADHLKVENRYVHVVTPTPLIPLRLAPSDPVIFAKAEFMNPSGSTKDRIARYILEKAWRRGDVKRGSWVVEASSGSTSISLSLMCAQMGLRFKAIMARGVSPERIINIKAYGGEVELVSKEAGIKGAQARATELAETIGAYYTRQFENTDNPAAHRVSTGREIMDQVPGGMVDAIVAGVGTGGTLVGIYQASRARGGKPIPVNARPVSQLGDQAKQGPYSSRIPGVVDGASKIFANANLEGLETQDVTADEALQTARELIALGLPVGPSSGLNVAAARKVAKRLGPKGTVVTVLCDRMDRYYTTEIFDDLREAALKS